MAQFPTISRSPGSKNYTEELSKGTIQVAKKASGLPLLNKLFTFDAKNWKFTQNLVSQTDKESLITFYEANKDVPFDWKNEQEDDTVYEVVCNSPPKCQLDRLKNRWRIVWSLTQYSPL